MLNNGICVAGNMLVDALYPITSYPHPGELSVILDPIERSTGGCVCNVIMDLAKLDPALPLTAFGRVGFDADGDFVLDKLRAYPNIDTSRVKRAGVTSFTLVIADESTKQRTFFQYRGANADFSEDDIDISCLNPKILHIGYLMLLDTLDSPDESCGTKMARLLSNAQKHGILTSIDVVSAASDKFATVVPPSLKFSDYCTINEFEAEQTTGILLRDESGCLYSENMKPALARLIEMGVSRRAIIHSREGAFGMDVSGEYVFIPSLDLPEGYVKGSVGAGDAFCAGVIYAAYKDKTLRESLELGIAAAACSLSQYSATGGVLNANEVMNFYTLLRPKSF